MIQEIYFDEDATTQLEEDEEDYRSLVSIALYYLCTQHANNTCKYLQCSTFKSLIHHNSQPCRTLTLLIGMTIQLEGRCHDETL